jgi:hypothetical protein
MPQERDASNFDFRVVALLTAAVTRPDLLHEYLADGKEKDDRGRPKALHDVTKWARLRRFGFPPELLAEMLDLFEGKDRHQDGHDDACDDIRKAFITIQTLFQTAAAEAFYCDDLCPDDDWFAEFVPYAGQLTQPLSPAGVQIQE